MKPVTTIKVLLIPSLTLLGLLCALLAYDTRLKVNALKTWTLTEATVTATAITQEHRSKGITYCPDISVDFELLNTRHTSKLIISQTPCSPFKSSIKKTLRDYATGTTVRIYANPEEPGEVKLSTYALDWTFYMNLVIASLSIATAIFLPFMMRSSGKTRDTKKAVRP